MVKNANTRADGRLWIGLSGASLVLIVFMMAFLLYLLISNSVLALWPGNLELVELRDGRSFLGQPLERNLDPDGRPRVRYKVANRELNGGADFRWVGEAEISERTLPADAVLVTRLENGDFFGFPRDSAEPIPARLAEFKKEWNAVIEPLRVELGRLGDRWQEIHLSGLKADYEARRATDPKTRTAWLAKRETLRKEEEETKAESEASLADLNRARNKFTDAQIAFAVADGRDIVLPLSAVDSVIWPNRLNIAGKTGIFFRNIWNLLSQYPREANTEGGVFPALYGTILLVLVMSISAFPLGVAAGVYLREYAKDNLLSRAARVAVNNLAGVPSIVYGIFGLGFFVYGLGGGIDRLFFPERVEAGITTFGAGGIIWSSLTLGLLTLPVVVVATEETLSTIPSEIRQGSLALGATRFQTLWRVILPMATPGIMTGFILAMARAAGEVAPLMLTGAVKSAHALALDGTWPYLHLQRKFMHLGFHIYDMGFQSPNVEAVKPQVYLTATVLLILIFVLNLTAIALRKKMRDKYAMRNF